MTTFEVGQKVYVNNGGYRNHWVPDTVEQVTNASVITKHNGAFRLLSTYGGSILSRRSSGSMYPTLLAPADHPRVQHDVVLQQAVTRRLIRSRMGQQILVAWATEGTPEALTRLTEVLTTLQAKYGEPL